MKIAGHTMGTPEQTPHEAVELFATLGMDGIELVCQDEYRCGISPSSASSVAATLGHAIRDHGLEAVSLTPYTNAFNSLIATERQAALDELRRVIDLAAAMGAPRVRIYAGAFPPGTVERDARWSMLVASLLELGEPAAAAGVTLVIENHFNTMTPSAHLTRRLIDEVDHPNVRILYDQANLTFQGDEAYPEAIRIQASRIALVHVKDLIWKAGEPGFSASKVFVVTEDERKVRSRVVGDGVLPWASILRTLSETGYDGWLSLEYERRWHPQDLPPAEDGMRRSAEHVRGLLAQIGSRHHFGNSVRSA